jgi:hypothetical protein
MQPGRLHHNGMRKDCSMWQRVTTKDHAERYVGVMTTGGIAECRQAYAEVLRVETVLGQASRAGFCYWLYDDGAGGRIALMFRCMPGCGLGCRVWHFEQVGLGYATATRLMREKLLAELEKLGVREFDSAPILKANPEILAAVRKEFAEIVADREDGTHAYLRLDRSKTAGGKAEIR